MPEVEIFETKDGSHSLLLPELNETYHSTHGAVTESEYVFLDKGLSFCHLQNSDRPQIKILEVGFGTGLNAWLTAQKATELKQNVLFTSLEKYPLTSVVINQLNYAKDHHSKELFDQLHTTEWNEFASMTDYFSLRKLEEDLLEFELEPESFDLVYFDAFAPSKQPKMWELSVLSKVYDCMSSKGVFVTYCAQGQFKRNLKAVGFEIEELPGPPGKKEMTRGIKP